jgi:hypothetical protein
MAYAHSKGVLHRDLKPANVMVGAFGEVQVVDWGLAKVLRRGGVADEKRAKESHHTVIETVRSGPGSSGSDSMVGSVMGTPAYMAPEQAQGEIEKLDERADVFSLGAILCELLTGQPPYVEVEGESTVVKAARAQLDPAHARIEACGADAALVRLCLDCLMPARAATAGERDEVAKAVHAYLTTTEERAHKAELEAARRASRPRRKSAAQADGRAGRDDPGRALLWAPAVSGGSTRARAARRGARTARRADARRRRGRARRVDRGRSGGQARRGAGRRARALSLAENGDADARCSSARAVRHEGRAGHVGRRTAARAGEAGRNAAQAAGRPAPRADRERSATARARSRSTPRSRRRSATTASTSKAPTWCPR